MGAQSQRKRSKASYRVVGLEHRVVGWLDRLDPSGERLEQHFGFEARQRLTDAGMNTAAEGDVPGAQAVDPSGR